MMKKHAVGTFLRGAAVAALVSAPVTFNIGCSGDDDDPPVIVPNISVSANDPVATDSGDTGQFTIALSRNTAVDLPVTFSLNGSATPTTDYGADHTDTITLSANNSSATVTVTPVDDGLGEGTETIILTLVVPDGYIAGESTSAAVQIVEEVAITDLDMTLKSIPAGTFTIGSPSGEDWRGSHEGPQHEVTISRPFWMADSEVTIGQFRIFLQDATASPTLRALTGGSPTTSGTISNAYSIANPKEGVNFASETCPINDDETFSLAGNIFSSTSDQPMIEVSHTAATNFGIWLTERETLSGTILPGYEYRLPTEAEWEYSCRAGTSTAFSYGEDFSAGGTTYNMLGNYAWYLPNAFNVPGEDHTHPIRTKLANDWGLYSMHGNVREWCYDWNSPYTADAQTDPSGPPSGSERALRGGCWDGHGQHCRSAFRDYYFPAFTVKCLGFRIVLAPILP